MNKVALVTGSAKGIGAAIIEELASAGYDCVINYNTSEKEAFELYEKIKAYNINSLVIKCDVSNEEQVNNMFNIIEEKLGGVDILINNAAVDLPNIFTQLGAAKKTDLDNLSTSKQDNLDIVLIEGENW